MKEKFKKTKPTSNPTGTWIPECFKYYDNRLYSENRNEKLGWLKYYTNKTAIPKKVLKMFLIKPTNISLIFPIMAALLCLLHLMYLVENFYSSYLGLKHSFWFALPVNQGIQAALLVSTLGCLLLFIGFCITRKRNTF